jgi:hypothetical protein
MARTLQVMADPVNRNGVTRAQAAADAIASARAEGLEPIDAEALLAAWLKVTSPIHSWRRPACVFSTSRF